MTIDDKIRDEKVQCNVNRAAEKISALSSGKIDNYECLVVKKYCSQDNKGIRRIFLFFTREEI